MRSRLVVPCLALAWASVFLPLAGPTAGAAQEVVLEVRAVDGTGALISGSVGGARITVRDTATGMVLAEGWQEGTPGARPYEARFPLPPSPDPVAVEIFAQGPLDHSQAMRVASTTLELAPGQPPPAAAIDVVLRGLIVEVLTPPEPQPAGEETIPGGQPLTVRARIRHLSGGPLARTGGAPPGAEGGLPRVEARIEQGGRVLGTAPLRAGGEDGTFTGSIPLPPAGQVDLVVEAATADGADAGKLRRHLYLGTSEVAVEMPPGRKATPEP